MIHYSYPSYRRHPRGCGRLGRHRRREGSWSWRSTRGAGGRQHWWSGCATATPLSGRRGPRLPSPDNTVPPPPHRSPGLTKETGGRLSEWSTVGLACDRRSVSGGTHRGLVSAPPRRVGWRGVASVYPSTEDRCSDLRVSSGPPESAVNNPVRTPDGGLLESKPRNPLTFGTTGWSAQFP